MRGCWIFFAGTGSVGIEALSQGAGECVFVEHSREALEVIRRNLEITSLAAQAVVVQQDAFAYLKGTAATFDLIYIARPSIRGSGLGRCGGWHSGRSLSVKADRWLHKSTQRV